MTHNIVTQHNTESDIPTTALPADIHDNIEYYYQLRLPVVPFCGRDVLRHTITATMVQQQATGSVIVLAGADGMGKTELALACAADVAERFPDGRLLFDMRGTSDNPLPVQRVLHAIIQTFKPQAQPLADHAATHARYRATLADKHTIIIVRNVPSPLDETITLLQPPPGTVVIVTTSATCDTSHPIAQFITVEPLSHNDAITLVQTIHPTITHAMAADIATACCGVSLALSLVANYLATCATDDSHIAHELIAALTDAVPHSVNHSSIDNNTVYTIVATILRVIYQHLTPHEQALLAQLRVFSAPFDDKALQAVANLSNVKGASEQSGNTRGRVAPPSVEQVTARLCAVGIVAYHDTFATYELHPLIQRIMRERAIAADDSTARRFARHYATVATTIENRYLQSGNEMFDALDLFDQERVNIEAGWAWARAHNDNQLLLLYACIVGHTGLLRYHLHDEFLPLAHEALRAAQQLRRKADECHVLNVLGSAYRSLGELHLAVDHYKRALDLIRTVRKMSNEVALLGNMGNVYLALGEVDVALKHYKRSLKIARKYHDVRGEAAALGQLGLAYAEMGNITQATSHYEESLVIARQCNYRDYEHEILTGMAQVALAQHQTTDATALAQQAVHLSRTTGNRRDEGYALHALGAAYAAAEQWHDATTALTTALAIGDEIGDKRLRARTLTTHSDMLLAQHNAEHGYRMAEAALDVAHRIGDKRSIVLSSWCMGMALHALKRDTHRVAELLQPRIAYEEAMQHPLAAEHAAVRAAIHAEISQ